MVTGPCEWNATVECCIGWTDYDVELRDTAKGMAELIVWSLSGRQFGVCAKTVRPCGPPRMGSLWAEINLSTMGFGWMVPYSAGGVWLNSVCGCRGQCNCTELNGIMLPGPVDTITEVKVDGVALDPGDYALVGEKLVRTDGVAWPMCQNMTQPDTEADTWSVTYGLGQPVPAGGNLAAGKLACEIIKACAGRPCNLPARVTEIVREGVTMTLLDPQDFLTDGRTGIALVDQWLSAVNPHGQRAPSTVWSPDLQQVQVRR